MICDFLFARTIHLSPNGQALTRHEPHNDIDRSEIEKDVSVASTFGDTYSQEKLS